MAAPAATEGVGDGAVGAAARWQQWDGVVPMQEAPQVRPSASSEWLSFLNPCDFAPDVWRTLRRADELAADAAIPSEARAQCNASHVAFVLVTETFPTVGVPVPWGADVPGAAAELRRQVAGSSTAENPGTVQSLLQAARAQCPRGPPGPMTLRDLCGALFEPASGVASLLSRSGLTAAGLRAALLASEGSRTSSSSSTRVTRQPQSNKAREASQAFRESADELGTFKTGGGSDDEEGTEAQPALARFGIDLVARAAEGKLDVVHGRDQEVDRILRVLSRRNKPNVCLLGHPGVGKTAVVEEVARRIHLGQVPSQLAHCKRLIQLNLGSLVGGTRYRGDFEGRMQNLLQELKTVGNECVLFIDELHMALGAGETDKGGTMDAANLLKPALARGDFRCIGATTVAEYRRFILNKDKAFERRFVVLDILEPSEAVAISMLQAARLAFEKHHGVKVMPEAVEAAVRSSRALRGRYLPDRALDVLDDAATLAASEAAQNCDFVPICRPEHAERAALEATRKGGVTQPESLLARLWRPLSRL